MTIDKKMEDNTLTFKVSGRLDTTTSPLLEAQITNLVGITNLIFDFADLEYISSAGLRVVLQAKKLLSTGNVTIENLNETVREVFDITGFSQILEIK